MTLVVASPVGVPVAPRPRSVTARRGCADRQPAVIAIVIVAPPLWPRGRKDRCKPRHQQNQNHEHGDINPVHAAYLLGNSGLMNVYERNIRMTDIQPCGELGALATCATRGNQ